MIVESIKNSRILIGLLCLMIYGCKPKATESHVESQVVESEVVDQISTGNTIETRFSPPNGFKRKAAEEGSFGAYLRSFSLLAPDVPVYLFDGTLKGNQNVHVSVLDIDVGKSDLQQCADAVMRLRAEYLWENERFDEIAFDFTNGWRFEYMKWRNGNQLKVDGNTTYWIKGSDPKESYSDFRQYLNKVFMFAGTWSLSKELSPKAIADVTIGDVFIIGGSPGHAVLVVDVAEHETNGTKAFLLAQSYMPAQQIHILKNLDHPNNSPWYFTSDIQDKLYTPEWTFQATDLKRF